MPVRYERLRRPAFRGRPRRHLTTSPPQLRHTPVTAEITPAAPRSISPHPLRSRSIFRVTLGLRNGGPRYGRCIVTPRYTPMPQTHQRQVRPTSLTSVQHFQHPQKNRREKLHAGGPETGMLFHLPLRRRAVFVGLPIMAIFVAAIGFWAKHARSRARRTSPFPYVTPPSPSRASGAAADVNWMLMAMMCPFHAGFLRSAAGLASG